MIATSSPAPRLLRVTAVAARWALRVLAAFWIVLALAWGGLHFLIVPRIGELRPWLEQEVSRALGVTVHIGALVARSNGLIPSVELQQVRLLDPQGRDALFLPSVMAALSPRSLVGMGFEQLYVDAPEVAIRRASDGQLWIAGLPLAGANGSGQTGLDWLFAQTELAIRHGKVQWTDEVRGLPTLVLDDVDVVLRNKHLTHSLHFSANPPAGWGARLSVNGVFTQPLLSRSSGYWQEWQGQVHAQTEKIDLAQLRKYLDYGVDVAQGTGALRAWLDVDRAVVTGATVDVSLLNVDAKVSPELEALTLTQMSGRLGVKWMPGGYEVFTEALAFETRDGLHWPGGNVRLSLWTGDTKKPGHGELVADRLDLAALAEIGGRLPLSQGVRADMQQLSPRGLVEQIQANWQVDARPALESEAFVWPQKFNVKGKIAGLTTTARAQPNTPLMPGIQGADLNFDLNQEGGKVALSLRDGYIDLPTMFEESKLRFDQLSGDFQWSLRAEQVSFSASNVRFSNPDAQGDVQVKWQTAAGAGRERMPGILDLQGTLSRGDGTRVHRYLPTAMSKDVRDYLRDSLLAGLATNVKFKVKGNLQHFPFQDAKQGEFKISADIKDATYAYAPTSILAKDSLPWPALTQVHGDLLIDHATLQVRNIRGNLGPTGVQIAKADAVVNSLYGGATVIVNAEARGPLSDALGVVNSSPLGGYLGKALARSSATGLADYRLKLAFPVAAVDRATVQGGVVLSGNEVQISPDSPRLTRARGTVGFTETGLTMSGVTARALGGDVRIDGGLGGAGVAAKSSPNVLHLQGTVTAEGLRTAREMGQLSGLAQYASGATSYNATLGIRAGQLELLVNSNLVGLALNFPAPFAKAAEVPMPLRAETQVVRSSMGLGPKLQELMQLELGKQVNVQYVRDVSGAEPKVLRGSIAFGLANDEFAPMPDEGVVANISVSHVDLDAWTTLMGSLSANPAFSGLKTNMAYWPTSLAVRASELVLDGRKISRVVAGGAREGLLWRANLDAAELSGYVEYRQPSGTTPGRLYARLARLVVGHSAAQDVENLLDEQPTSIPALDVVVEDFELRGKHMGRMEVDAVNLAAGAAARETNREWRLNRFNIITPEGVFTASGNWANIAAQAQTAPGRSIKERRRTTLNFKLDIADAGDVLNRFGMPGVVRKGKGKIEGQVTWLGSPITLDYPSLSGNFNVGVESGQFLKADPGIAKLLGVLSLQSLPRRLALDFRDVFSEGFAFDFLRGDVAIDKGIAHTNNLQMKGVNAAVMMEGQADIARETQDIKVVVIPEINAGSASLIASAINPLVGLSTFLAQVVLRRPLIDAATQEFHVDGTWVDPRVTKVERKN